MMVPIRRCDDSRNVLVPRNAQERIKLWDACMKECKVHLGREEFDQIIREVYDDIFSPLSDTGLESISTSSI